MRPYRIGLLCKPRHHRTALRSRSGPLLPPFGPDRIVRNVYDAAGQVVQVREAVGTSLEQAEATFAYSLNGQRTALIDGNGNRSAFRYDGHDRLVSLVFPSPTPPTAFNDVTPAQALASAGAVNESDREEYTLDANGNRTRLRLRDGQSIGYSYDALDRMTFKDAPNAAFWENDVTYAYDLRGLQTYAGDSGGNNVASTYDAAGRRTAEINNWFGTTGSAWDADGNRTRLTYRDGFFVDYAYLATGEMASIVEPSGLLLARFGYDGLGRRTSLYRGNDKWTTYQYDGASRLTALRHDLTGGAHDIDLTFAYSPASQIVETTRSNDAYAHAGVMAGDTASGVNGLNQLTQSGGTGRAYDLRGNMTFDGTRTFGYTAENRLATSSPGGNLAYDPTGRLIHIDSSATDFRYDGDRVIEETVAGSGQLRTRWVHGPGVDEPIVSYDANGVHRWTHADERGSLVATSDGSGNAASINTYDEYGVPGAGNTGRFGYTGQLVLPEVRLQSYKARMYKPEDGRFMQTDPVGYDDQFNLYIYVANDPVNVTDPTGMCPWCGGAAGGAVLELVYQVGYEGKSVDQIDWVDVGISAAAGATGYGLVAGVNKLRKAEQKIVRAKEAIRRAERSAERAGGFARRTRAAAQIVRARAATNAGKQGVEKAIVGTAAVAAAKAGTKAVIPPPPPESEPKEDLIRKEIMPK